VLFEGMDMKDATAQKEAFADTWSNSYMENLFKKAQRNEGKSVSKGLFD